MDSRELSTDLVLQIGRVLDDHEPLLADQTREDVIRSVAADRVGLGVIEKLMVDPSVTDVLVNGPGRIWVERDGRLEETSNEISLREIMHCIERLVAPLGLRADRANPIVDARLGDGSRVSVVLPPLAPDGPLLAVRRHAGRQVGLCSFADDPVVEMLERIVHERLNVIVYGPTGSGKTTLVRALVALMPRTERVVLVEDTAELALDENHVVRLEARPGALNGAGRASIRDLVRASLRLRPDRIIVGEVRGAEAVDMIWAMSTGHRGSLSTCHASSALDALGRIETMVMLGESGLSAGAVRDQLRSAVDVLIGVERSVEGARRVCAIHLLRSDGSMRALFSCTGTES